MPGMLFTICTCYQSPADNQDLGGERQYDKLQAHKTMTGVWPQSQSVSFWNRKIVLKTRPKQNSVG